MADLPELHQHYFNNIELNDILQGFSELSNKSVAAEIIISVFMSVNQNKLIGKTQVTTALENAKRIIQRLNLPQQDVVTAISTLQFEMAHPPVEHKSRKGFIAIDLDGTALVQKIDKNFLYGLTDQQSHVRQTLIQYVGLAQAAGYDIVVLTARPEFVESSIKSGRDRIGTKPTDDIVDILDQYGIKINSIARATTGLKGAKMQELMAAYKEHGADDAIGILFDDQLKQINDVALKNNPKLHAYDINSPKDLIDYLESVAPEFDKTSPLHPEEIIRRVQANSSVLIQLNTTVEKTDFVNHPKEAEQGKIIPL